MINKLHTLHHPIVIDTPELAEYLEDAMIARDGRSWINASHQKSVKS